MVGMIFLLVIILIGFVSASYCCEKTKKGAWCQPVDSKKECAEGFKIAQTGCESTSYCKFGTCINFKEGTCDPNTAQKTCEANGGTWDERDITEIPQCKEGCCVLGSKSIFDTLTRCKKLSADQGFETDFRRNIRTEKECSSLSGLETKGACVFKEDLKRTCKFITKKECMKIGESRNVSFYEKILCSSEKLGTDCGPSKKTTCHDGKVYFVDTCGNLANIYDADRQDDAYYWTYVIDIKDVKCDDGKGNINSKTCGLCDYHAGSTCGAKRLGENPKYGDYICRDLSCEYKGKRYKHKERWCAKSEDGNKGTEKNLPGSEHFVLECRDGEVRVVDECRDWRNMICVEEKVDGKMNAICTTNKWQDCTEQDNKKDCLNENVRDCVWVEDEFKTSWSNLKCVPKYAPAFDFWEGEKSGIYCSKGTVTCEVTYEKKIGGKWECVHNCYCLEKKWLNRMNTICNALGDCGVGVNYIGKKGWYELNDLLHKK